MITRDSPCKGCTERSTACADKCPKDARGEYGYKAWKAALRKQQAAEREYNKQRYEDWKRGEECEAGREQFAHHKNRMKRGNIYGR